MSCTALDRLDSESEDMHWVCSGFSLAVDAQSLDLSAMKAICMQYILTASGSTAFGHGQSFIW